MGNKWKIAILLLSVILLMCASCNSSSQTDDYDGDTLFNDIDEDWDDSFNDIDENEEEPEPVDDSAIDLFRDVEDWFVYSNGDGNGSVTIEIPEDYIYVINENSFLKASSGHYHMYLDVVCNNKEIGEIYYAVYGSSDLREGDSFEVKVGNVSTLKSVSELLSPTGKRAKEVTKEYIYPNTGAFLTCIDDFKYEYIYTCANYIYEKFIENDRDVWSLEEMYLLTLKPDGVMSSYGRVWVVAKVDLGEDDSSGEPRKHEVWLGGLAIDADGELVIYENNIDHSHYGWWTGETVEEELTAYTDDYDIWLIGESGEKR